MIDVYILTDGEHSQEVSRLIDLFEYEQIDCQAVQIPRPIGINEQRNFSADKIYEAFQVQWCLNESLKNSDHGVLILKDSSIAGICKDHLLRLLEYIHLRDASFDLFYLCRWQDECQRMTDISDINGIDVKIGRTYSPMGIQALYFSRKGRDILLGHQPMRNGENLMINMDLDRILRKNIYNGNIKALCTTNNVFEFDVTRSTSNDDYIRTCGCRAVSDNIDENGFVVPEIDDSNNLAFLWFILVIIIVIVLAFVIIRIAR